LNFKIEAQLSHIDNYSLIFDTIIRPNGEVEINEAQF